jgi:hypothetical protein
MGVVGGKAIKKAMKQRRKLMELRERVGGREGGKRARGTHIRADISVCNGRRMEEKKGKRRKGQKSSSPLSLSPFALYSK